MEPARISRAVLLFLGIALGIGAIGALLAAPAAPPTPIWYPGSSLTTPSAYVRAAGVVLAVLLLAPIAYLAYKRIRNQTMPFPSALAVVILSLLLLGVGFVAVVHVIHPAPESTSSAGANGTGSQSVGSGAGGSNGTPVNGSGPTVPGVPGLPYWTLFVAVAAALLLLGALAVPRWLRREPEPPEPGGAAELRSEIETALRQIESEPSTDPREIIRALYARLLGQLDRAHTDIDPLTPREIAIILRDRFRVRESGARELTRIFEEARYSTLPLAPGAVDRMRRVLEETLDDLARAMVPPPLREPAPAGIEAAGRP